MSQIDSFRVVWNFSLPSCVFPVALRSPVSNRSNLLVNTKTNAKIIVAPQPAVTVAATAAALVFGSLVMLVVTLGQLVA